MANILERDVWICRDMQLRTLRICLLIASSPQEGKIAAAYWFLLSGFGAMLSGTQLIWYILLVLLHKCSFVCISSFHLLLPFKKKIKNGSRDALGTTVSAAFISYESLAIIPPSSVKKSQPASAGTQMNDCCLLCWIISQEMCVHRRLCLSPPFNMFLFVFLGRKTKCCHKGREKAAD